MTKYTNYSPPEPVFALAKGKARLPIQQVFTEKEAAEWLRISRITLQRIRLRGEISFSRVGGTRVVYTLGQLKAYLAKCEVTARI